MTLSFLDKVLNDTLELINLTRKGVTYDLFTSIVAAGSFTMKDWSIFLHISERTLQRYKKEKKSFDPIHSERILAIAQLQKRGIDLFGDKDNFSRWMNSKIVALGGIQPKDLLDNSFGIALLNDELTRIEHGVLA